MWFSCAVRLHTCFGFLCYAKFLLAPTMEWAEAFLRQHKDRTCTLLADTAEGSISLGAISAPFQRAPPTYKPERQVAVEVMYEHRADPLMLDIFRVVSPMQVLCRFCADVIYLPSVKSGVRLLRYHRNVACPCAAATESPTDAVDDLGPMEPVTLETTDDGLAFASRPIDSDTALVSEEVVDAAVGRMVAACHFPVVPTFALQGKELREALQALTKEKKGSKSTKQGLAPKGSKKRHREE